MLAKQIDMNFVELTVLGQYLVSAPPQRKVTNTDLTEGRYLTCIMPLLATLLNFDGPSTTKDKECLFSMVSLSVQSQRVNILNTCGARAGKNQIRNLSAYCQTPSSGALAVLRAILQDRKPPGLTERLK